MAKNERNGGGIDPLQSGVGPSVGETAGNPPATVAEGANVSAPAGAVFPPAASGVGPSTIASTAGPLGSIDDIEIDPNDQRNFVDQIKQPFIDALGEIVANASPAALARYADAMLPEAGRLQILMRNPDVRIASVAERRYKALKIQALNDTARYGIRVEQRSELAFISALDTAVAFGRRWLLGQVPAAQPPAQA